MHIFIYVFSYCRHTYLFILFARVNEHKQIQNIYNNVLVINVYISHKKNKEAK